jgi:hypothetical protein
MSSGYEPSGDAQLGRHRAPAVYERKQIAPRGGCHGLLTPVQNSALRSCGLITPDPNHLARAEPAPGKSARGAVSVKKMRGRVGFGPPRSTQ